MRARLCAALGVVVTLALLVQPYAGAAHSPRPTPEPTSSLRAVAAANRLSEAQTARLLEDPAVHVAKNGRLYFVDPVRPGSRTVAHSAALDAGPTSAAALTSAPVALQSRPGSRRTIFLDFDGATLTSSPWGVPDGFYAGYDRDGDASTFSDAENAFITDVWRRVSEAYSAYDVNVTTADLGTGSYTRSTYADTTYGVHVLANDGGAKAALCGSCSGVAFLGTFADAPSAGVEVVWTFPSFSSKENAETTVHEVGHTLGLSHDGITGGAEYYAGHGDWAPFMGASNTVIQQFSKGEYAGANNTEDDLAVMVAHGLPRMPDDHLSTVGSASSLGARTSYAVDGIIGTRADADVFQVVHPCADTLTATATGIGDGSTVDLTVEILSSGGALLDGDDPASGNDGNFPAAQSGMNAAASTPASNGTYYVRVDGVGRGDPVTDGYSDYASLGQYQLAVSGCPGATGTAPDAPTGVTISNTKSTGTLAWTAPTVTGSGPITGYRVTGIGGAPFEVPATTTSIPLTGLVGATTMLVSITALSAAGSSPTTEYTKDIAAWAPTAPPDVTVTVSGSSATVNWAPVAYTGGATYTAWALRAASPTYIFDYNTFGEDRTAVLPGLPNGTYSLTVTPTTVPAGAPARTVSFSVGPKKPSAPRIGTASSGVSGGTITATARWAAPLSTGGAAITGYRVRAYKYSVGGSLLASYLSVMLSPTSRAYVMKLPSGRYRFKAYAYNKVGVSPASAASNLVIAR